MGIKDLIKLTQANPDLPILPLVDSDVVCDDFGRWAGSIGEVSIDKVYYDAKEEYPIMRYSTATSEEKEDIVCHIIGERIFDHMTEDAIEMAKDSIPWKECIVIEIDLPETDWWEENAEKRIYKTGLF